MLGALLIVFREVLEAGLLVAIVMAATRGVPGRGRWITIGIAAGVLMWHNAWMARHGREIADEMRRVGTAVSEGSKPRTALAVVIGLAVLREGSEVVLFLYGILAS